MTPGEVAGARFRLESMREPGTDRAHRPTGEFAHEWWSLTVTDERSDVALFATLAPASAFASEGGGAFSLLLARGLAPVARFLESHPMEAVSAEGPLLHVRVGENTLTAGRDHNLTLFELTLDETRPVSGERVRGHLLFQLPYGDGGPPSPLSPSRAPGPVAAAARGSGLAEETFSLLAADAIVRGEVVVEDRRRAVRERVEIRGRGSIEHRSGRSDLRRSMRFAVKSSFHHGDLALFSFRVAPTGSAACRTLLVLTERGRPLVSCEEEAPASDRLQEEIDARLRDSAALVRIRHRFDGALERGPHFLRCRPVLRLEAEIPGRAPIALSGGGLVEVLFPPGLGRQMPAAPAVTRWRADHSGAGLEPGEAP